MATFRVVSGPDTSASNSRLAGVFTGLAGIVVECDSAKQMAMAVAYPQEWLLPLAHDLSARWDLAVPDPLSGPLRPSVQVVQKVFDSSRESVRLDQRDVVEQPRESRVQFEEHADGLTLKVPSAGLLKGSKGPFWFGVFFCGGPVGMLVATYLIEGKVPILAALFLLAFFAVGLGILLSAINMGRRRAVLAVVENRLMILQTGLFGSKRREWAREEIDLIAVGSSGLAINDQPVLELQVHLKLGTKFGILSGRNNYELRWIATVLRRALQTTAEHMQV